MSLHAYSVILSVGSIGIFLFLGALVLFGFLRKRVDKVTYFQWISYLLLLSLAAVCASLIYQLVYLTPVCELCWWQRISLYPIVVISFVGFWKRTIETHVTTAILASLGLFYACYHYYYHFQGFVLGNKLSLPCSYGGLMPACTDSPVFVFGFVTIPFMGVMVFGSLLMIAWFAGRKLHKEE